MRIEAVPQEPGSDITPAADRATPEQALRQRIDWHSREAVRRNVRCRRLAAFLHVAIPLTALALTAIATMSFPHHDGITAMAAFTLTALAGANAIFEPARRYSEYVECCIALYDIQFELDCALAGEASPRVPLQTLNAQVSEVGRRMAGLPIVRMQNL